MRSREGQLLVACADEMREMNRKPPFQGGTRLVRQGRNLVVCADSDERTVQIHRITKQKFADLPCAGR